MSPFHALQKQRVPFYWAEEENAAFEKLKEKLITFVVQCDACGHNIGVVLMQEGNLEAYESRLLQGAEWTL